MLFLYLLILHQYEKLKKRREEPKLLLPSPDAKLPSETLENASGDVKIQV